MKILKYIVICIFISFFSKGQTIIDSLSINPNPFQKRTAINFSFINTDTVSIHVYNTIGTLLISPITNSIMVSGSYQDSLIMDSYPDGMYFVILKLGNRKTITKKAIKSNTAGFLESTSELSEIRIYPNPFDNILKLDFKDKYFERVSIKIYDALGKFVLSSDGNKQEIDLQKLESGVYYLKILNNSELRMVKIIKK